MPASGTASLGKVASQPDTLEALEVDTQGDPLPSRRREHALMFRIDDIQVEEQLGRVEGFDRLARKGPNLFRRKFVHRW